MADMPIAILVDSGTASASEIVAGALQDHDRAVLLGTGTYGKGSAQSVFPLSAGGALNSRQRCGTRHRVEASIVAGVGRRR
jgi:carboxyl-terminal processing protease